MLKRRSRELLCAFGLGLVASCALGGPEDDEDLVVSHGEALQLNRDCNDKFEDIYAKPSNLPSYNQSRRGDVVRCAKDRTIPVDEVSRSLAARMFQGIVAQNAVRLLRITYRTERLAGQGDVSSAIVLLPVANNRVGAAATDAVATDAVAAGAATTDALAAETDQDISVEVELAGGGKARKRPPLVVFAHGTVPYGQTCAYSRNDPTKDPPTLGLPDTELGSLIALATRGYPVIMPDYAGFVKGSRSAGYLASVDEAHSLLDATRAAKKLLKNLSDSVVLLGHSQGGHAVLSAQALARTYGLSGQLVGVAAFAPFWAPLRTMGLIVSPLSPFTTRDTPDAIKFAIEYFYTHGELIDGVGGGQKPFLPQVANTLKEFTASCDFKADPQVFGATTSDFFKPEFLSAVGDCGVFGGDYCSTPDLAWTWEQRFKADRPQLDRNGAPVLMWHGANDVVIDPFFAKCGIDKLRADLPANGNPPKFTFCGDRVADHETLLAFDLARAIRWIDARALGGAEPQPCEGEEALSSVVGPLFCPQPPGNLD
jgi:pimeloyl-ACP methyl ester carboxylesterase